VRRRDVIAFVSSTAAVWVLGANAQQRQPIRLLGIFMSTPETDREFLAYIQPSAKNCKHSVGERVATFRLKAARAD
jgi:hypothetical protein